MGLPEMKNYAVDETDVQRGVFRNGGQQSTMVVGDVISTDPYDNHSEFQTQQTTHTLRVKSYYAQLIWGVLCTIACVIMLGMIFSTRQRMIEQERSIAQLEERIIEYQASSETIRHVLATEFNYEMIHQKALEEGMTLDESRIRNVQE